MRQCAIDDLERARERHWPHAVRSVQLVALEERLQLALGRLDPIVERQQVFQAFALLHAKLGKARLCLVERCEKGAPREDARVGQRGWHAGNVSTRGFVVNRPTEPLADKRLGAPAVRGAKRRQHGIGQSPDRDDDIGKAAIATQVVGSNAVEPWEQAADRRSNESRLQRNEQRLDPKRPCDRRGA